MPCLQRRYNWCTQSSETNEVLLKCNSIFSFQWRNFYNDPTKTRQAMAFTARTSTSQLTFDLHSFIRSNCCVDNCFNKQTDLQASLLNQSFSKTSLHNSFWNWCSLIKHWCSLLFSTSRLMAWVDTSCSTLLCWLNINSAMAFSCDFFSSACVFSKKATFISRSLIFAADTNLDPSSELIIILLLMLDGSSWFCCFLLHTLNAFLLLSFKVECIWLMASSNSICCSFNFFWWRLWAVAALDLAFAELNTCSSMILSWASAMMWSILVWALSNSLQIAFTSLSACWCAKWPYLCHSSARLTSCLQCAWAAMSFFWVAVNFFSAQLSFLLLPFNLCWSCFLFILLTATESALSLSSAGTGSAGRGTEGWSTLSGWCDFWSPSLVLHNRTLNG